MAICWMPRIRKGLEVCMDLEPTGKNRGNRPICQVVRFDAAPVDSVPRRTHVPDLPEAPFDPVGKCPARRLCPAGMLLLGPKREVGSDHRRSAPHPADRRPAVPAAAEGGDAKAKTESQPSRGDRALKAPRGIEAEMREAPAPEPMMAVASPSSI